MIYADYAATTPVDPGVLECMLPYLREQFFNPSALYPQAQMVKAAMDQARSQVASLIGGTPEEIIFTSGGTESDNLAILGTALHPDQKKRHLITSSIEHHAILSSCDWLESHGFRVTRLRVDAYGRVDPRELEAAMTPDTFLVSVMWVNNELGTVQNIGELSRIAHAGGALFHTDAVQAATTQHIDVAAQQIDLLSISSHKIYGPKGCGALYVRKGVPVTAMHHGGQQEGYLRGGTENVPAIIGMGAAAQLLQETFEDRCEKMIRWKNRLVEGFSRLENVRIDSPLDCSAPSILHLSVKDAEAEGLLFWLSRAGVAASMGSACNTQSVEPSHVIRAINLPPEYARGSIRLSLGCGLDDEQIEQLIQIITKTIHRFQ